MKSVMMDSQHRNAVHQIEGGTVTGSVNPTAKGCTVRIIGGTCDFSSVDLTSNSVFEVSGGVVSVNGDVKLPATSSFSISGGVVSITNMIIKTAESPITISGGVAAIREMTVNTAETIKVDATRLNFGDRLYSSKNTASLLFSDSITFGAFGDWSVHKNFSGIKLGGDVVFDTTDCFDGVTPRSITMIGVTTAPETTLKVAGCGSLALEHSDDYKYPNMIKRITLTDGATLFITNNARVVSVNELNLGAGSKLHLRAGKAALDVVSANIDRTAEIVVTVPDKVNGYDYPVITASDDETASSVKERIRIEMNDNLKWSAVSGGNAAYVASGDSVVYGDSASISNIWTGSSDGYWSNKDNWTSKVVPGGDNKNYDNIDADDDLAYFGRGASYITNDIEKLYVQRFSFLSSCNPMVIVGNYIRFKSASQPSSSTGNSIYSRSKFPVVIESEIFHGSTLSASSVQDSYIAFNGKVTAKTALCLSGEVRIGGELLSPEVRFQMLSGNGRSTTLHVTDGGLAVFTNQTAKLGEIDGRIVNECRIVVDEGGLLVFSNETGNAKFEVTGMNSPSVINGCLDIHCPYMANGEKHFSGTGTVQIASVKSVTGKYSSFTVGGGLTVRPYSWTTVTEDAPDGFIKIAVTNSAVLSAASDWTYGPAPDVVPTTTAQQRALTLAENATLLIRTEGRRISFADPIAGPGHVVVEEGSRFALAGDLLLSAKEGWTTFATVASFTCPEGSYPSSLRLRTLDNGDGTVDVQAKIVHGLAITIR